MKKQLLFLCLAYLAIQLPAQTPIPNSDFELWTSNSVENPMYFPFTSNENCFRDGIPSNVSMYSPGYHGQNAIVLTTIENSLGYMLNTDPKEGNPALWANGMEYTEMPTGVRGYYKYNVEAVDSGLIIFTFRKNHAVIGDYVFRIGGVKTEYTLFDFNFMPALTVAPDSVIVGFVASDYYKNESGVAGSTLVLDSVSLKGVSTQPLALNGDSELWETRDLGITVDEWNTRNNNSQGVTRTTDAKNGNYAIELSSHLGDQNGVAQNDPGYLTNGYWSEDCNCNAGGIPFPNRIDTLTFWYKYFPVAGDVGQMSISFHKNAAQFDGRYYDLHASANYQYVEIPFDLWQSPDTVILSIISSQWNNRDLMYQGSKLYIDDLKFKTKLNTSMLDELNLNALIYPNPNIGTIHLSAVWNGLKSVKIYSVTGETLYSAENYTTQIDIHTFKSGVYFICIELENARFVNKITKL